MNTLTMICVCSYCKQSSPASLRDVPGLDGKPVQVDPHDSEHGSPCPGTGTVAKAVIVQEINGVAV